MYPHTNKHSSNNLFSRLSLGRPCCRLDHQPIGNTLTRSLTIQNGWTPERKWLRKPKQKTNNQSQSIWFKLPIEIRSMIYHEVLGGNRVAVDAGTAKHLKGAGEWLYCQFPPSRTGWKTLRENWGVPLMDGRDWNRVKGLLSLVISCRRM